MLDIGCGTAGTGYLLGVLARQLPSIQELAGVDPAPSMVEVAAAIAEDDRIRFSVGVAEELPYADQALDLLVSTTFFDHWGDQLAGLRECKRVLQPRGRLVLVDQFSLWLTPTLLAGRRGKARTKARCERLLCSAGFQQPAWHDVYAVIIHAVVATA